MFLLWCSSADSDLFRAFCGGPYGIFQVETGASPPREKEPVSLDEPMSAAPDEGVVVKTTSSDRAPTVQMEDDPLELSARGMMPVCLVRAALCPYSDFLVGVMGKQSLSLGY